MNKLPKQSSKRQAQRKRKALDTHPDALPEALQGRNQRRANTQHLGLAYANIQGRAKLALRLDACTTSLMTEEVLSMTTGLTKHRVIAATHCHCRFCETCQHRANSRYAASFSAVVEILREEKPKAKWLLLTLTVRNPPADQLREAVKHLNKSWERLTKLKDFPAIGWAKAIESPPGKADPNTAHLHIHALLLVPFSYFKEHKYWPHAKWVSAWRNALRADYDPSVNIQTVKRGEKYATAEEAAAQEVFKYVAKAQDLTTNLKYLDTVTTQLRGTRRFAFGGIVKTKLAELKLELSETGEQSEPSDELKPSGKRYIFKWNSTILKYRK